MVKRDQRPSSKMAVGVCGTAAAGDLTYLVFYGAPLVTDNERIDEYDNGYIALRGW